MLHLFGVGVLVRDAVLVNVGVEVCHDAAVAAGAVAVAVVPRLAVGVEELHGRAFGGFEPPADQLIVAAGVLDEHETAAGGVVADEVQRKEPLPRHH